MKSLIKKFSYNSLVKESEIQGWIIPTMAEVKESHVMHELVWVSDKAGPEDEATHGIVYNTKTGWHGIANKSHLHNVVVIKQKCKWVKDREYLGLNYFNTSCKRYYSDDNKYSLEEKGYKYCIFCGKEIENGITSK